MIFISTELTQEEKENYEAYLKSFHWHFMIRLKRESVGNKCEKCESSHNLQVHHLTYDRIGHERLDDLQVLCEYHHKEIHGIETYAKELQQRLRKILMKFQREMTGKLERSSGD